MTEPHEEQAAGRDAGEISEGTARREPELADLISAWYEAARARHLARRRGLYAPCANGAAESAKNR